MGSINSQAREIEEISEGAIWNTADGDVALTSAAKLNSKATDGTTYEEYVPVKSQGMSSVNITIGMFFNGTMNNRTNTDQRTGTKEHPGPTKYYQHTDSYDNDYSNVARMEPYYTEQDKDNNHRFSIYIEGIGTRNLGNDSSSVTDHDGGAMGAGSTGIRGKVYNGCKKIEEYISKKVKVKYIDTLTFDVFGFSRGAAAARNFIYEATRADTIDADLGDSNADGGDQFYVTLTAHNPGYGYLGYFLRNKGYDIGKVVIRFVGLFESVSSYSPHTIKNTDFDDDVAELHLDAVNKAARIIHLTATDEHRKNFSLTNIYSAGSKGTTLVFPGVHSDIGGSYPDNLNEVVEELAKGSEKELKELKGWLVGQGWYKDKELTFYNDWGKEMRGTRTLYQHYSYIFLHMMGKFSVNTTGGVLIQDQIEMKYKIAEHPLIEWFKKRLYQYAFGDRVKPVVFKYYQQVHDQYKNAHTQAERNAYQAELNEQANLRMLRNRYLHWSSNTDGSVTPNEPRLVDGKYEREIIDDRIIVKHKNGTYR